MPFENESHVKAYAYKINSHKNGVDILIKLTVRIFQPDAVPALNNALQNAHAQICDWIYVKDTQDLIRVLYAINAETFKNYFTCLESMISNKEINYIHIATLIEQMLKVKENQQSLPLQCAPNLLSLLTKQLLKQLPKVEINNRAGEYAPIFTLVSKLAVIIYCVDANQCVNFSKGLADAAHAGELTYYQIAVLIDLLLDQEHKEKFSIDQNNTYLRSLNIITDLLITIIPETDRSTFLLIIFEQLFNFQKFILGFDLTRRAGGAKKFSIRDEKFAIIEGENPLYSQLVDNIAMQVQGMLDKLNKTNIIEIPEVIKMVCQLIAVNLNKNLIQDENKERTIVMFVASFMSNKLCGDLMTKWASKTFKDDTEALSAIANYIIKPFQHLVTYLNLSAENRANKELGLPKKLVSLINEKNQQVFIKLSKGIIEENPSALQKFAVAELCTVTKVDTILRALPLVSVGDNQVSLNSERSQSKASGEQQYNAGVEPVESTKVTPILSLAAATHLIGDTVTSPLPLKPTGTLAVASGKKYLDKELDEQEIILRLQIYYNDCLNLAVQLNVTAILPSQKSGAVQLLSSVITTQTGEPIPSAKKILADISYLTEVLAQNKTTNKNKLLDMHRRLHTAVVNYEAYKAVTQIDNKADQKIVGKADQNKGAPVRPEEQKVSIGNRSKK